MPKLTQKQKREISSLASACIKEYKSGRRREFWGNYSKNIIERVLHKTFWEWDDLFKIWNEKVEQEVKGIVRSVLAIEIVKDN